MTLSSLREFDAISIGFSASGELRLLNFSFAGDAQGYSAANGRVKSHEVESKKSKVKNYQSRFTTPNLDCTYLVIYIFFGDKLLCFAIVWQGRAFWRVSVVSPRAATELWKRRPAPQMLCSMVIQTVEEKSILQIRRKIRECETSTLTTYYIAYGIRHSENVRLV